MQDEPSSGAPLERRVGRPQTEREAPGPCGDPDCEDGYVFNPPLQDGARGFTVSCSRCEENWRRYWAER